MVLAVNVRTREGEEICHSYLPRIGGWTEERYFSEAPESQIVEFEDGDLIVSSPVSIRHQKLVRFLTFLLRGYVGSKRWGRVFNGPAVVRLRADLDYKPDIFVVLQEHLHQLEEQYFSGAPELIVEVMSPSGRNYDLRTKADNYYQHGVREYWAVDPAANLLYHHTLSPDRLTPYRVRQYTWGRLESPMLSGFWLEVSWLWAHPLPVEKPLLDRLLQEP
jgi:Uma2 family endonuclease